MSTAFSAVGKKYAEKQLKQHGVKGQKWGVRRSPEERAAAVPVSVKEKMGRTKVKTSGGTHQPAHEDAIAAAIARQKVKGSHLDALSNKELQHVVQRMNLEQQYSRLSSQRKSAGRQWVEKFFKSKENRGKTVAGLKVGLDVATTGSAVKKADLSGIGK